MRFDPIVSGIWTSVRHVEKSDLLRLALNACQQEDELELSQRKRDPNQKIPVKNDFDILSAQKYFIACQQLGTVK